MTKKQYTERANSIKSINSKLTSFRSKIRTEKEEFERLKGIYSFMPKEDDLEMSYEELKELDEWYNLNYSETRDTWVAQYEDSIKPPEIEPKAKEGNKHIKSKKRNVYAGMFKDSNGQLHHMEYLDDNSIRYYQDKGEFTGIHEMFGDSDRQEQKIEKKWWKKNGALAFGILGAGLIAPYLINQKRR